MTCAGEKRCLLTYKGKNTPGSQVDIKVVKEGGENHTLTALREFWDFSFKNEHFSTPKTLCPPHEFNVNERQSKWQEKKKKNPIICSLNFLGSKLLIVYFHFFLCMLKFVECKCVMKSHLLCTLMKHYTYQVSVLQNQRDVTLLFTHHFARILKNTKKKSIHFRHNTYKFLHWK